MITKVPKDREPYDFGVRKCPKCKCNLEAFYLIGKAYPELYTCESCGYYSTQDKNAITLNAKYIDDD